jgi:hypothetical protein
MLPLDILVSKLTSNGNRMLNTIAFHQNGHLHEDIIRQVAGYSRLKKSERN